MDKNNSLAQEFLLNSSPDDLQKLDFEVAKVLRILKDLRSAVRKERMKNHSIFFLFGKLVYQWKFLFLLLLRLGLAYSKLYLKYILILTIFLALTESVARDGQMAEQVNRRYEVLTKNPQFGRAQAVDYMHKIASEHENNLINSEITITKVEETLRTLMDSDKVFIYNNERLGLGFENWKIFYLGSKYAYSTRS